MGFLLHGGPHLASTCPKRKHVPLKVAATHAGIGELEDFLEEIEEEQDVEETRGILFYGESRSSMSK